MSRALRPIVKGGDLGQGYNCGIIQLFGEHRQIVGSRKSFQVRKNVQNPVTSHVRLAP
ncbi:hypothetical protein [Roseobacter sp. EG26]|uniref:hypothetical protein n=1 Tax=Roseobacter sp. EG26 TaxID=3412477 RepID=UPI003CE50810